MNWNCRCCKKECIEAGGDWYRCLNCDLWVKYNPFDTTNAYPVSIEHWQRYINNKLYILEADYDNRISILECFESEGTVWEGDLIIITDPKAVENKIRTILVFQ